MKSTPRLAILFFVFSILVSCDFFKNRYYCPDDSKNLGSNLKLGIYTGSNFAVIADENNRNLSIPTKETLLLHEDSTFAYFAITSNNDTIKKILNGNFKVYQDSGFPWYVFELKSDSVYEKVKVGSTPFNYDPSTFSYTDFFIVKQFTGLSYNELSEVNLLSDVDEELDCFSLAFKANPHEESWCDPDWDDCCDKIILVEKKTFCLEQPKTSQPNSTGDSL
jgi:hypothetical protein